MLQKAQEQDLIMLIRQRIDIADASEEFTISTANSHSSHTSQPIQHLWKSIRLASP